MKSSFSGHSLQGGLGVISGPATITIAGIPLCWPVPDVFSDGVWHGAI